MFLFEPENLIFDDAYVMNYNFWHFGERNCFETTPFGLLENSPVLQIEQFN